MGKSKFFAALGIVSALVAAGCTSGTKTTSSTTAAAATATTAKAPEASTTLAPSSATEVATTTAAPPTTAAITGPAPGVTDTEIKIGVSFVDTAAMKAGGGPEFDLGKIELAYTTLADEINKAGGINGRKLKLVLAGVDPTKPASAEANCVKLTEDEKVFIAVGFFTGDTVNCVVDTHATAVVGGTPDPKRLASAKAPWISTDADTDVPKTIVTTFIEKGLLKGKVGVVSHVEQQEQTDLVTKTLADAGVKPVASAVIDTPAEDEPARRAAYKVFAEKAKAAGVDTLLLVGQNAATQYTGTMQDDASFRPKLLFTALNGMEAFATGKSTSSDTSQLKDAFAGGLFGPNQAAFDEPGMQKCIATLKSVGVEFLTPDETAASGKGSDARYRAAFFACPEMALLKAFLDKAGKNLNYGTLAAAINTGFEVTLPGNPAVRKYGPGNAADGNPAAFLFTWDEAAKKSVLAK